MRTAHEGPAVSGDVRPPLRPWVAWAYVAYTIACAVVYVSDVSALASSLAYFAIGLAGPVAIEVGLRRNRAARRRPWRWLQLTFVFALANVLLLGLVHPVVSNLVAVAGYASVMAWLVELLRARRPQAEGGGVADSVLVGVAAFLWAWVLLISPTFARSSIPLAERVIYGTYPVIDTLLIFLGARLALMTKAKVTSLWFLMIGIVAVMVGDLGYALDVLGLLQVEPWLLEAPYVLMFGFLAAVAVHPSMRILTEPAPESVRPLRRGRALTVSLALAAPALLVLVQPLDARLDREIVASGSLVLAGVVLWRTARAVNEHAASEQRLGYLATHDSLTDLPNRTRLLEHIQEALDEWASTGPDDLAVFFLDLDGFKYVNDTWGHPIGDELLVAVGIRLEKARHKGELVARIGGDEFVLVHQRPHPQSEVAAVAQRLLAQFTDPFSLSVGHVYVTPSIGVAFGHTTEILTPEMLIRDADIAMYQAKATGRNRWSVFDESMRQTVTRRYQTEVELRRALERGELRLYYQPIIRLSDGALQGLEALVRWDHPERGLVPPLEFIPVIEDTDLILPVGEWVLRNALQQLARWRERNGDPELQMAVNVAARQLRDPDFVATVRGILLETNCPPGCLTLEITESSMVEDSAATHETLQELRALGIGLSVDDFGTGYSSLGYLKKFPVMTVKIDRGFVFGLGSNPDDEAIVQAVLAMAHALGLEVVAEGVETISQRNRLRELGCDAAQGFLLGRPAPASASPPVPPPSHTSSDQPSRLTA